ncbi:MAG: hypothetical protein KY433_01270 [Actinobacteria bacterium]|nr:hypothetical protein [Actinomycetota bacterium]
MTLVLAAPPLVACADAGDARCRVVQALLRGERGALVLPGPVPKQVDALLAERVGPHARRGFFQDLAARRFHVEPLTSHDVPQLERIEREYPELALGLSEMAMIVVAARLRCTRIVTFDEQRFRQIRPLYGDAFTLLPADR